MPGHAVKSSVASFYVLMDRLARPPYNIGNPTSYCRNGSGKSDNMRQLVQYAQVVSEIVYH